jgi:DNA polymerase-3 subunit delta'
LEFEPVWSELLGQPEAVSQLRQAVANKDEGLQHAWLITGPPGSGRSNAAAAFAAAILCESGGCGDCKSCRMVGLGSHPDVTVLATEKVIISIEEIRNLVAASYFGGSISKYQIMIIEDADRMAERSSNVLLKTLEEPPAGTIWILCAPSEADMLPTIRSRVRRVALKQPSSQTVADLLVSRDGINPSLALQVAAEAQGHIAEKDTEEKTALLATLGIPEGGAVPPALRADIKALEEGQKRRATRSLRDGIDRILVDLMSLYRDVLIVELGAQAELVNADLRSQILELAATSTASEVITKLEALAQARVRISSNVRDLMVLESLAVALRRKK